METKKALRILCCAIIIVFISCIGASLLQTSGGKVKITDLKIPTNDGQWISAQLYLPKAASAEHKVPLVITTHGYLNSKEMQAVNAIELSRRGIATIAFDMYYNGESSPYNGSFFEGLFKDGNGMIPLVEYAYNNLNYVDKSKIGVMGHSLGGMCTWVTLGYYSGKYDEMMKKAAEPSSDGGTTITAAEQSAANAAMKVSAGLPTSMPAIPAIPGGPKIGTIHANVGINAGVYDEASASWPGGNGDLSGDSKQALQFINSVLPSSQQITSVELGKFYGNLEDKTMRVVYNPKETHPWQTISPATAAASVNFFTKAFQMDNPIPTSNQNEFAKELFNFLGVIGVLLAIVPIAVLLLKIPVFSSLKTPVPDELSGLTNMRRKLSFWGSWALSWIVSGLTFFPLCKMSSKIFTKAASYTGTAWFSQPQSNALILWGVVNAIVGLALFYINYKMGQKDGITSEMLGIKTNVVELLKTLALALCIFIGFYAFVLFAKYFFNTDFRFWLLAIKGFTPDRLVVGLQYLPFFFIFFAVNSIMVNSTNRVKGQKEWVSLLLSGLGNVLGLVIILVLQYGKLFLTGVCLWTGPWVWPTVAISLVGLMFVVPYITRYLFKATGKVWLGAFTTSLIYTMILVANTSTFLPLK